MEVGLRADAAQAIIRLGEGEGRAEEAGRVNIDSPCLLISALDRCERSPI